MTNQQYCLSLEMISGTSTSRPRPADSLLALSRPGVPGRLTVLLRPEASRAEVASRRAFCRCSCSIEVRSG